MNTEWKWGAEVKMKGEDGFNDAAILTFNSHAVNSLIRELVQNSNDAKAENQDKIIVKVEQRNIKKKDIPAITQYEELLNLIQEAHPTQRKFFSRAQQVLQSDTIPFLIYSDYNTKGLTGSDDDNNSSFVACLLSEGKSVKGSETAGGSFGIGKNAIYGVSTLRTVLYSSMDGDGNCIFQGVAKIASYRKKGTNHEGRIYLGEGESRSSVRNSVQIPTIFRRESPGLSQFVMGVNLEADWHKDFVRAILRNYWMLLVQGGLEVQLLKDGQLLREITSENVHSLLTTFFSNEDEEGTLEPYGNPFLFYRAYKNGENREFDIPHLGKCRFHYLESEDSENNVAYLRNDMVIFSKIEKRLVGAKVSGVFYCDTEPGNEILRKMEPPKHDSFEPQMLEEYHDQLSKKDGEKILSAIKSNIRTVIKELIDSKYKNEIETPSFLTELFEDLQRSVISGATGAHKNERGTHESLHKVPAEQEFSVSLASEEMNSYVSTRTGATDVGSGDATGGNPRHKHSKRKGGTGTKGGSTPRGRSPKLPISTRMFHYRMGDGRNIYKALIMSKEDLGRVELSLSQYGDSGNDVAFKLHNVTDESNGQCAFGEVLDPSGLVAEYKLWLELKKGKNSFFLEISDNQKSAFTLQG